jgi:hypothetical protein
MNDTLAPVLNPQVLFTELDDGTGVLLNLETKFYFTLNRTAVFIWKTLAEHPKTTRAALTSALVTTFQVDAAAAERDLDALLQEMVDDGLVSPAKP